MFMMTRRFMGDTTRVLNASATKQRINMRQIVAHFMSVHDGCSRASISDARAMITNPTRQPSVPNDMINTGIEGLDHVLLGGFLRAGFYLLQGDPGSGKTTVALQFVHTRLKAGERCLYVTLT